MSSTWQRVIRLFVFGLVILVLVGAIGVGGLYLYLRSGRGIGSPTQLDAPPAPTAIPLETFETFDGLNLPLGFRINRFVEGLNGPRMLAIGPEGDLYVTERGAGRVVRLPDEDGDGRADEIQSVVEGLQAPSGLAFYQDDLLYVAEPGRVLRFTRRDQAGVYMSPETIIGDIPTSGHNTRTLLFSQDGSTLFVSIGSSCNVCVEEDPRRAAITRYNPDGTGEQLFAVGLRNAVGLALHPDTGMLWASNNGRDWLGDDLPPETVNQVSLGDDFGWPRCHAGRIEDPEFGEAGACQEVTPPAVELQAHSAPLGLNFYTGASFPEAYQGDLFVAYHGSWNRTVPTGYKVVRIPFDNGVPGAVEDFAWGWLAEDGSRSGRPVDVITGSDGALYISDDNAGVIYRVIYVGP